jgi:hypothetical protein
MVPQKIFVDATFYMAFTHNMQGSAFNLNQMDPSIAYAHPGLTAQAVANPFYGLPSNIMPGSLAKQKTVAASQLLSAYPQYGALYADLYAPNGKRGKSDHYYSLQLKAQRQMADGVFFVLSYGYSREHEGYFFNDQDTYNNKYTLMEAKTSYNNNGTPRHNLRASGTYQLPFGRGRKFLGNTNRLVDAVVGGWSTSSMLQWASGPLINFNAAVVTGDPCQNVPAGDWFNPSVFKILPADTPRTNPWYYPCARGPHFWELDSTAVKYFNLTEQVKLEVRAEFYNMPNHFVPADPVVSVGSGSMGKSIDINPGMYGRQLQYVLRLHF